MINRTTRYPYKWAKIDEYNRTLLYFNAAFNKANLLAVETRRYQVVRISGVKYRMSRVY